MKKFSLFIISVLFSFPALCFADFTEGPKTSNKIPWSSWWWPMRDSNDPNLYDDVVFGQDGPLKKYDFFSPPPSGAKGWETNPCTLTDRENSPSPTCTGGHFIDSDNCGHCDAWSAASIWEDSIQNGASMGVLPASDGSMKFLNFRVGDLKGLLTEKYMSAGVAYDPQLDKTFIYGSRYDGQGQTSEFYKNMYPAQLLQALREMIRDRKAPVIMDFNPDAYISNYPVYKYYLECTAKNDGNNGHICKITLYYSANEPASTVYDYVGAKEESIWFTFNIRLINEVPPPNEQGQWTGSSHSVYTHPDFAWFPTGRTIENKDKENPQISYEKVKQLIHAAPFVMRVQISQKTNIKYDKYWEWLATPQEGKNRRLMKVKDEPLIPALGPATFKLIFSRTMNPGNPPEVEYTAPDGSKINTMFPRWSGTNFKNDTLEVDAFVPCVSGAATLSVKGMDIENRDIDGDPSTFAQKWEDEHAPWDLNHRFRISQPATPQVVATVPEAEPVASNHWAAKDVEVNSLVKIIFSEKMFERVGDAKYTALLSSLKIQESGKIKVAGLSEEQINEWCAGTVKDGWCAGMINLAKLAPLAVWKAKNNENVCGETTEASFDYSWQDVPRLLRYGRDYRVTVKSPTKITEDDFADDGAKSAGGEPLDGNANEVKEGSPDDNFTLTFNTKKPQAVLATKPGSDPKGNAYLSLWIFGDLCKVPARRKHVVELTNKNSREEYLRALHTGTANLSPKHPVENRLLCYWKSILCADNPDGPDGPLLSLFGEAKDTWGALKVFPESGCEKGTVENTLVPAVAESRVPGREKGSCLVPVEGGECKFYGEALAVAPESKVVDEVKDKENPPPPGGPVPPDEGENVPFPTEFSSWDLGDAEVFVGANGFYNEAGALLSRFSIKRFPMDIESINGALLKYRNIVILPSASLSGYDRSEIIKTQFADFVRGGGILVTFTQQRGFDYAVLPGGEVSAAGYLEDISCYTAGSQIDQYHPIMAGQTDTVFDGGIDGYFLTWPSNAKILLRRKKNNFPALIVYPYGQGFVVASTLYTDFAGSTGQLTADETQLLKDLILWLKNPKDEFAETKPGQTITLTLNLHNATTQDANGAKITVQDNMNQVVSESTVFIGVPAGQTVPYDFSFTAPSSLGNYTAHYSLLFDAQEIQAQAFSDTFSVTEHIQSTTPDPQLQFSVTAPGELFPLDSPITFTIHVRNNGDTERALALSYWSHASSGSIGTVTVPARGDATLSYTTPRVYFYTPHIVDAHRWDFYLNVKDEQGNDIISRQDPAYYVQGLAYMPSVTSILTLDKKSYTPSGAGSAAVKVTNTTAGPFTTDVSFSILNPNNQKVFETTQSGITFSANETKTENITFTLPASLITGPYTVQASITRDGGEIGKATGYFTVEKAKLAIEAVKPGSIKIAVEPNTFMFKLTNTGQIDINSGNFTLTAKGTEGAAFFTQSEPFSLNVSEQKTLNFNIPFTALQFGTYKLSYTATTETGIILGSTSINAQPLFTLSTDKPSYKAGDTAQLTLKVTNPDIFIMDFPVTLSAPSVSFTQTQNVTLSPKEQKTFTFSMPITNTANAGTNALVLTAAISKPYTQNFSFFVQPAKFTATLDKLEYQLNETGNVAVTNAGGLDASATYTISLTDKDGVVVENTSGTLSLPVSGTANVPVIFTKPEILSGMYRLSVLLKDTRSSLKFPFEQYVTYSGVSASVSVSPMKSVYTNTETPMVKTKITPTGNLQNAKLTVKILNPNPQFNIYSQIGASASVLVDPPYIWFGTMYHGAKRLEKSTNTFTDVLPNTYIYALASDSAYVYLGTEAALYRYDKVSGQLANFPVTNIRALSRDGSFLWIGTDNGVKKWDTLNEIVTESYSTQNGLPENPIWTLLSDGNKVYIATFNKGLFMLDKLGKTLTPVSGLPDLRIRGMALDAESLWIATWNGVVKLNRATQSVEQTFTAAQGLADKFTYSIAVDGNWLWVGTLSGLSRYDKIDGSWKTYTKADGLPTDYVRSLAVDSENVYLGCFMK